MSSDVGNSDQKDWEFANQTIESEFDESDRAGYEAMLDAQEREWEERKEAEFERRFREDFECL